MPKAIGSAHVLPCDVEDLASVDAVFSALGAAWGSLDFLVHCIGFSDRNELKGRYADTSRENFIRTMVISAFSFTEIAKRAAQYDALRRRDADAHLRRRDARCAEL